MTVKTRNIVVLSLALAFIAFVVYAFMPAKISKDNSRHLTGIVSAVDIGSQKDIVVMIEGVRGIQLKAKLLASLLQLLSNLA